MAELARDENNTSLFDHQLQLDLADVVTEQKDQSERVNKPVYADSIRALVVSRCV